MEASAGAPDWHVSAIVINLLNCIENEAAKGAIIAITAWKQNTIHSFKFIQCDISRLVNDQWHDSCALSLDPVYVRFHDIRFVVAESGIVMHLRFQSL